MSRPCAPGRGPLARAMIIACLASLIGCAGREGLRRPGGPRLPEAEGTTIGRDLRRVPRGAVATPPSMGVDLVEGGRVRDEHARRADHAPARGDSR
ncbi:hypothetical protein [Paludisphaera sp.]|uniref:hypothetical protein n=1 Tax=Paludisphaera sp. TaxID=2017432 RepID=UPI00301DA32A